MEAISTTKAILSLVLGILITWKPAIVVQFPGFLYTSDMTKVFVVEGCVEYSNATVAIFCLVEVLLTAYLWQKYLVPWCFGATRWNAMNDVKQRKMVGSFVKISIRFACAIQLMWLILPYVDFGKGLFPDVNIRK